MKKINKIFIKVMLILISVTVLVTLLLWSYFLWGKKQSGIIDLKSLGAKCKYAGSCGNIIGVDCGAAYDGAFYYVDKETGKILEYCGGYCQRNQGLKYCRNCPPKEWTCNN